MRYIPKIILLIGVFALLNQAIAGADTLFKDKVSAYRDEGLAAQKRGDLPNAIKCYQKAISLDSTNASVYNDLGVVYEALGRFKDSEDMYLRSIAIDSKLLAPYFNLGLLYKRKGDLMRAAYYFKKRIELGKTNDPWTQESLLHLGSISELDPQAKKMYLEMEANFLIDDIKGLRQRELRDDFTGARVYIENAKKFYQRGDYVNALKEINKAMVIEPKNKEAEKILQKATSKILLSH
ncbi:MAG: tetratricopeptide repeat protein [Candidatus Omnitrophota bacterium]